MKIEDKLILPRGFTAAGTAAGIKRNGGKDMSLVVSDRPAVVAGTFTTNQIKAATVKLCMERLKRRTGRAIVVNSGNANACNGEQGLRDATDMAARAAEKLGLNPKDVYVSSTGSIGVPMPMDKIRAGIDALAKKVSHDGGNDAMQGILTTDRWPKCATVQLKIDGQPITISAFAKGAGMIEPNMATMLCYLLTDGVVDAKSLQTCLSDAVKDSFNRISVDGDMSTNDTVLFFANGAAENTPLTTRSKEWKHFVAAVRAITLKLALGMVKDGEGATKLVTIRVTGAKTEADAEKAGRAVANSLLVKTSWNGGRCNWGRVMDALGYSEAKVDEGRVRIFYDDVLAVRNGRPAGAPRDALDKVTAQEQFTLNIDLGVGRGSSYVYACDCGHPYIDINV